MTHEEAKFILRAYRPNGSDAPDVTFAAALELAQKDPVLRTWFEREETFDRAVASKLRQVAPPPDLRAAILAGARAGSVQTAWWQQPKWLAAAASVAVLFATALAVWPKRGDARENFTQFVLNDARHDELHGGHGAPKDELQAQLGQTSTHLSERMPVDFEKLRATGCRTISFQGHDMLEICFKRDGQWFHVYIGRKADFPTLATLLRPVITERDRLHLATWADAANVYAVVSEHGAESLQRLL